MGPGSANSCRSASAERRTVPGCRDSRSKELSGLIGQVVDDVVYSRAIDVSLETACTIVTTGLGAAAELVGVSARTLRRRFEARGCSAGEFVSEVRTRVAVDLVARRWRTDQVASALGFASPASLARFLRRRTGTPVRRLRRKLELVRSP